MNHNESPQDGLIRISREHLADKDNTAYYVIDSTSQALAPIFAASEQALRASGIYRDQLWVADNIPRAYREAMARVQLGIRHDTLVQDIDQILQGLAQSQHRDFLKGLQHWIVYCIDQYQDVDDRQDIVAKLWKGQLHIGELLGEPSSTSSPYSSLVQRIQHRLHGFFNK